jgi:hypothetical protein
MDCPSFQATLLRPAVDGRHKVDLAPDYSGILLMQLFLYLAPPLGDVPRRHAAQAPVRADRQA